MLKRILLPLDGSDLAERALIYATGLAEATGAEILLLRVANAHTLPGVDPGERQLAANDEAHTYLDAVVARVAARGLACDGVVRFGTPAECITESARTQQIDLIVMTTHGRTAPGRWIFGSVAEAVVATSPVPVLVQRAWQPLFGDPLLDEQPKIIVPLDGSAFAESAVEAAATLAGDLGGKLVLLTVQDDPSDIRDADDYLAGVQQRIAATRDDVPTTREVRNGDTVHAIEEVVAQLKAALVFMATHGRTGPRRAVLGSIAGRVLNESDVPLVLIRPASADKAVTSQAAVSGAERVG